MSIYANMLLFEFVTCLFVWNILLLLIEILLLVIIIFQASLSYYIFGWYIETERIGVSS